VPSTALAKPLQSPGWAPTRAGQARRLLGVAESVLAPHRGSAQTLRTYRAALAAIARAAGLSCPLESVPWEALHLDALVAIASRLRTLGAKPASTNLRLIVLRKVAEELADRGCLTDAELRILRRHLRPEKAHRDPSHGRALHAGELTLLAQHFHADPLRARGLRNGAILLGAGVGAGLRRDEIARAMLADLDREAGRLRVLGKGRKPRLALLTNGARKWLDAWLEVRCEEPGPLFLRVNKAGAIEHGVALSGHAINALVGRCARTAGIGELRAHDLRRSFITLARAGGAQLDRIADLVGHSSVDTTRLYDRVSEAELRAVAELVSVPF
jgi:integrase/recombinase XerD